MNTQTNWFAYFRAVEVKRKKREAKFGRLPLWFYPCAFVCAAMPIALIILVILP